MPYPNKYKLVDRNPPGYNHKEFMKSLQGFISDKTRKLFFCEGRKVEPKKDEFKKHKGKRRSGKENS